MSKNIQLVCIDFQFDFCDPGGRLYVPGAEKDVRRIAHFIDRAGPELDDIHVTLDSHQRLHIAHPEFVVDRHGKHPVPFTVFDYDDAKAGDFRCAIPGVQNYWLEEYLRPLKANGRYPYCIWPPHCLIGTRGHALMPELNEALVGDKGWAIKTSSTVSYLTKGSSWKTEHYSAVQADVPDDDDPSTQLNMRFIEPLEEADMLIWTGEAGSHCGPSTYKDVAEFGDFDFGKWVLLEDCQSPVSGFEKLQTEAMADMEGRGMRIMTSTEVLKELGC